MWVIIWLLIAADAVVAYLALRLVLGDPPDDSWPVRVADWFLRQANR